MIDLSWLKKCQRQLHEMAEDIDHAQLIIDALDKDAELREELPHIYVKALRTIEMTRKK